MSKQPLQVPTGSLIFNDISCRGFWISSWYDQEGNPSTNRDAMHSQLAEWFLSGELVAPEMEKRRIDEYKEALGAATSERQGEKKQLFILS
jgi:trans-2-enoyl-CoA reductase